MTPKEWFAAYLLAGASMGNEFGSGADGPNATNTRHLQPLLVQIFDDFGGYTTPLAREWRDIWQEHVPWKVNYLGGNDGSEAYWAGLRVKYLKGEG